MTPGAVEQILHRGVCEAPGGLLLEQAPCLCHSVDAGHTTLQPPGGRVRQRRAEAGPQTGQPWVPAPAEHLLLPGFQVLSYPFRASLFLSVNRVLSGYCEDICKMPYTW